MDDVCEVVITAPDAVWLAEFVQSLVDDRLCACGHVIERIRSVYRWDGAVHDEAEARVGLHTRTTLVDAITARADRDHPYEVPCVIALPIVAGNPAYIRWIIDQTTDPQAV